MLINTQSNDTQEEGPSGVKPYGNYTLKHIVNVSTQTALYHRSRPGEDPFSYNRPFYLYTKTVWITQ